VTPTPSPDAGPSKPASRPEGSDSGPALQPVGALDATQVPRFAGPATFARLPQTNEVGRWDVAVVGVPFDAGTSYRPGARFGPAAIRQGSRLLRPYNPELRISPFDVVQVVDAGDVACTPFDIEAAVGQIERAADDLLDRGSRLVALGGDHTIALPLLRATAKRHGPVALVHFDAHLDTWDTYFGARYTHGTPFRRAWEEDLLLQGMAAHVGTRGSLYGASDLEDDDRMEFWRVSALEVGDLGVADVIDSLRQRIGSAPVYISIDVDVLDPAHAPGTGTPEAGGLTSRELLALIRGLDGANVVGADVVEVAPAYDHAEITSIAAANVAYELLCLLANALTSPTPQ
jgi:agmatinase